MSLWFACMTTILMLILASLWMVFYQLMKQQGRLLLHVDNLEQQMALASFGAIPGGAAQGPKGLALGEEAPAFELPDLDGNPVSLKSLLGRRTLLVHWTAECGYCHQAAAELGPLQEGLRRQDVQLVLVAYGEAEPNRKLAAQHGIECPILLQRAGSAPIALFATLGTPVAYLLDEGGKVEETLVAGSDGVARLAGRLAGKPSATDCKCGGSPGRRSLERSRIERNGLKPGTPAPAFELPGISGETVSLETYRGRRVLLVFSDPQCGPCEQLSARLAEAASHCNGHGPAVLMVSRGDAEDDRHKAAHGFPFRVGLQRKWEVSKAYGIFVTPAAFVIGTDGRIERGVVRGTAEILALAAETLPVAKEA